jgi:pimeloyl-ACP methyl ester carboxylesterase
VLVHGLGGTAEAWVTLVPLLSRDFLIYAPDLPGFGQTPLAPEKQCITTHANYLGHFLDALGYPQVTLVGQSLGGWIATRYAAEHPERVKRLYLLNSAGLMREGMYSPYTPDRDAAKKYIERIMGYRGPVPRFLLDAIVKVSLEPAFAEFIANYDRAEEVDELLARIHVPTTIVWGTEDRIFPLCCAYDFHQGIPNSRLILAPGVSHNTQVGAARMVARTMREDARV